MTAATQAKRPLARLCLPDEHGVRWTTCRSVKVAATYRTTVRRGIMALASAGWDVTDLATGRSYRAPNMRDAQEEATAILDRRPQRRWCGWQSEATGVICTTADGCLTAAVTHVENGDWKLAIWGPHIGGVITWTCPRHVDRCLVRDQARVWAEIYAERHHIRRGVRQ